MRKLLFQPLAVAIITLLTIILCISLYVNTYQLRDSARKVAKLQESVTLEQKLADQLTQQVEEAQTPIAKETIIRDQLLMQQPGEYVVQIPDLADDAVDADRPDNSPTPWEAWKELLF